MKKFVLLILVLNICACAFSQDTTKVNTRFIEAIKNAIASLVTSAQADSLKNLMVLKTDSGNYYLTPLSINSALTPKLNVSDTPSIRTRMIPIIQNYVNTAPYVNSDQLATKMGYYDTSSVNGALRTSIAAKEPLIPIGSASQYYRGDKTWVTFPAVPTNTNQLTNGAGYLTSIDTTNIGSFALKTRSLISGTSPIAYSNGTISISQAGAASNGYVNSTDWNTFNNKVANFDTIQYYTSSGRLRQKVKEFVDTFVPTTATAYTMDISAAGFTTIKSIHVDCAYNTSTLTSVPIAQIKSYSTTSVVVNIMQSNNATIGSLVTPIVGLVGFSGTLSNATLLLTVTGY